jgi:hypothetical protein
MRAHIRSVVVTGGAVLALATAALPAAAATSGEPNPAGNGQSLQLLSCAGVGDLLVRTNQDRSSDHGGWSTAHIVEGGSGTLIPTSFTFSGYDETTGTSLFESGVQAKGDGNGNHAQAPLLTCTQSMEGPLSDFLEPGETPPPGDDASDIVLVSFTVTALRVG